MPQRTREDGGPDAGPGRRHHTRCQRRGLGKGDAQGAYRHHAPAQHAAAFRRTTGRALLTWLETSLDAAWAEKPNPGRTETLRRLNRTEYRNAVRDLLALDIDANSLLPADESGHGFDNVTVGDLPPTLLDRYISAAQKVSRLAIGSTQTSLQADVIRLPADRTQETHVAGLPLGTRGGVSIPYTFAQDGEYEVQVWLARDLSGNVGGLRERSRSHEMVVLVDREPVKTFTIQKLVDDDTTLDKDLRVRVHRQRGPARHRRHVHQ